MKFSYLLLMICIALGGACDNETSMGFNDAGVSGGGEDPIWETDTSNDGGASVAPAQDAGDGLGHSDNCDADNDGYLSILCGGDDCDDTRAVINPGAQEWCSFEDENCDGNNNELLDCTFIAAGPDDLYRVDPFKPQVTWLFTVDHQGVSGGMLDIDRDPEGQLIAIKRSGLYALSDDGSNFALEPEGQFQDAEGNPVEMSIYTNGMAINSFGTLFLTNSEQNREVTPYVSMAQAHTVHRASGTVSLLGSLQPYVSSGDCVALKNDSVLMTARDPANAEANDFLVHVDSTTAQTTLLGDTGHSKIFGLSASFDYLFGVTEDAKILKINEETGESTLLLDCSSDTTSACPAPPPGEDSIRFWGAANGD